MFLRNFFSRFITVIECGEHRIPRNGRYPKDIIIRFHRHCCYGWDVHARGTCKRGCDV